MDALENLYLVTVDGRVLELQATEYQKEKEEHLHIYEEMAPITPFIASTLDPIDFCRFITDTKNPISVPKLAFVEMILSELSEDLQSSDIRDLPYANIDHLKDCLIELTQNKGKKTKTVIRATNNDLIYRTIKNGFFVGDSQKMLYYPFPSREELEEKHYAWWRSAQCILCK